MVLSISLLTFTNYLGHAKTGCQLLGMSTAVCEDPALTRAHAAIVKREAFVSRPLRFIRLPQLEQMASLAEQSPEWKPLFWLFLASYVFMIRVPSEALLVAVHAGTGDAPVFHKHDDCVEWFLPRRKNWSRPSVIRRGCWCRSSPSTCPVHVMGAALGQLSAGTRPFACVSAADALSSLRRMLSLLSIPDAEQYRTHDLRRGHNQDMIESGKSMMEILVAAGWLAPGSHRSYSDRVWLEMAACMEAHDALTSASAD